MVRGRRETGSKDPQLHRPTSKNQRSKTLTVKVPKTGVPETTARVQGLVSVEGQRDVL